jgi:hypothetical protein
MNACGDTRRRPAAGVSRTNEKEHPMPALAFAVPLLPGKTDLDREAMLSCSQERKAEHDASREALGIDRMAIWIQQTPVGDTAVVYVEADDLEAVGEGLASSDEPFDRWFRRHVREVHGIDVEDGFPPVEQVLDFRA